ncbi:hypothetical protein B0H13DRAFT_2439813 [Mycena leptocephala]|nr:hypothetical protein B0H13DRAFT_2439813 [Mycena leptocephala]
MAQSAGFWWPSRRFSLERQLQTQKRQRKFAVSIEVTATNADLAREVASTLQQPIVTLEISGGFELRDQDGIDTIGDGDIVTARLASIDTQPHPALVSSSSFAPTVAQLPQNIGPDMTPRFKISFVTAENAVSHAKLTPREQNEPLGVLGFDGEFVSGNTTLRDVENEAARVLQWTSPDSMDVDSAVCVHEHQAGCSCHIAQDIERYGLSSTLHCRFTVDGSPCRHAECPYSHAELQSGYHGRAAALFNLYDALAFPCPTCLARAETTGDEPASVPFCPLVQNAGCGHFHHAHCIGPRNSPFPRAAHPVAPSLDFHARPSIFMYSSPNCVPFPVADQAITLTTDAVIETVERFLQDHQFELSGLSLRIHFRDAFTSAWDLMVLALDAGQRLSRIQPSQSGVPSIPSLPYEGPHTTPHRVGAFSMICTRRMHHRRVRLHANQELFASPRLSSSGSAVVLYAVKRKIDGDAAAPTTDKPATVPNSPCTSPMPLGTRAFHKRRANGAGAEARVLAARVRSARFPPAIRTGWFAAEQSSRAEEKAALAEVLFMEGSAGDYEPRGAALRNAYIAGAAGAPGKSTVLLKRPAEETALPRLQGLPSASALVLRVEDISAAPREMMGPLDSAARDFVAAIRRANHGDLVSQGPLEIKSVEVVPPRIVVDQEGLLAVFTGRGCGTTRDVNFFRPTNGGDTEVDVNDVSHTLQNVIRARKAEDTWQVDCFGEVSDISRPPRQPDEAIVMCLDLSESMNGASGVQRSGAQAPAFDSEAEMKNIVAQTVANMNEPEIMEKARAHLESQDRSCHHPWTALLNRTGPKGADLLRRLAILASRDLLLLTFSQEDEADEDKPKDPAASAALQQLSCFVFAVGNATMTEQMRLFLVQLVLHSAEVVAVGVEPYDVPRKFVDFRTGDFLVDPVHPSNAPSRTFVNRTSQTWCEQGPWPAGYSVSCNMAASQLKKALATWTSGTELLPKFKRNSTAPCLTVTLQHRDQDTTWKLSSDTTTRTLYQLANRATRAMYSKFTLVVSSTTIADSGSVILANTALVNGGTVEMVGYVPHTRQTCEFEIVTGTGSLRLVLPDDTSLLAMLSYIDSSNPDTSELRITDITLWHGLKDYGDGMQRGQVVETNFDLNSLIEFPPAPPISLECSLFSGIVTQGARRAARRRSRNLTRLHLLKELFTVFLNRAGSFDTTASLVLGLVTFSAKASVEQEMTPIFENLDKVWSVQQLAYRPDLPNLRKRIVIVSDGEDTSSGTSAREVALALQRARIVVDSVQVGRRTDTILHAISVATGGYRFSPRTSLADALSIFDLETMLYSGERPPRPRMPFVTSGLQLRSYENLQVYPVDVITVDRFPPRAEHPLLKQPVKSAANSVGMIAGVMTIKAVVADPHPNIDLYFNDRDMSFLKIILEAPRDVDNCPYKGGTFLLTCDLPVGYPAIRLRSSDITLKEIFSLVYGTLLTPDLENPLEIQASLKYYEDDAHASKTRAQWRDELGD